MPKKLLTIEKVVKTLEISERSVYRYIKSGLLKATKIGGWKITEKDLQDFIKLRHSTNIYKK